MSWDVILPFLRPIEPLIQDPEVSDILVNAGGAVFAERHGALQRVPGVTVSEKSLRIAVRHIARVLDDDISEKKPLLDARLPDGSRVTAVYAPCSVGGTTLAIRKFQSKLYTVEELVRVGTLTPELLLQLQSAVELRRNILIAGGTGTGKTTLLNALAAFIGSDERIVVIEDTAELQIDAPNLVRLEARREQPDSPAVTIRDLLRATLRLRPDRILLGEVRGGEAFDLLQALNTGHQGSLCTIHANTALDAISRFSTCVLQSGVELPYRAIRTAIAGAVDLVIHLARGKTNRVVTEFLRIKHYIPDEDRFEIETLHARK